MKKITLGFFQKKSKATIKGLMMLFVMLLMNSQSSWGQLLVNENFSYTIGTDLTANGWAVTGTTALPNVAVSAASITYPGYLSSGIGEGVTLSASGQDVNKTFTAQTTGVVYAAILVNLTAASVNTTGDYFLHFAQPTVGSTFEGRVFVKRDATNKIAFGLSKAAGVATAAFTGFTYSLNTTYLIVVEYSIVAGTNNDVLTLYINPVISASEPLPTLTAPDNLTAADLAAGVGAICLRQGNASNATPLILDGIRVGNTWADVLGTTWDGSAWSSGAPSASIEAIIAGAYTTTVNGAFTAKKLTVNSGSLTINSGTNITVVNEFVNNLTAADVVIENNANLIQSGTTNANTGNITVNRNSASLKRLDYTLWSSPVANASKYLLDFSPLTSISPIVRFYTYNPSTNNYSAVTPSTTPFATGTGYLIRMPDNHPATPTVWSGSFVGIPNNGDVNLAVTSGTYNSIGNPYPSTISADAFITANGIAEALYFWRKTNNSAATSYATYTFAGGTGTGSNSGVPVGDPLGLVPSGIIQVGQGFIAKSTSTTLSFTNAMRIANNANQILKTKAVERNRIWLNLSNGAEPVNQMMVAYMTGATQDIDATIDGRYINDNPTALNSLINNEEFVIQGRSLPFDAADVVPMSFKTTTDGTFTIAIDHVDGLFSASQDIFLKDNTTGIETDLKAGSYTFTAVAGVDNARFSLKYQKTLGINAPVFNENSVTVFKNRGTIHVKSGTATIDNVKIYDISGRLIYEKSKVNANETSMESAKFGNQVLIVEITSDSQVKVSKKLVN